MATTSSGEPGTTLAHPAGSLGAREPAEAAAARGGAPLAALLPAKGEVLALDAVLDRFVTWAGSAGFTLYPAQEEALLALLEGRHVVLATPTGSGKSLVATFLHFKSMAEGKRSVYTCPIKALVNEKFFALCQAFGAENVGMMTGDAAINREAPVLCCTAEILANIALREGPQADVGGMIAHHHGHGQSRQSEHPAHQSERDPPAEMLGQIGQ